ncbi:MAG: hypothetical protein JXA60_10550 [Candidatus Coatesbacteria bacterium]|nr:hypothetical protein [Candidatus Coatesbacteria bacterium]
MFVSKLIEKKEFDVENINQISIKNISADLNLLGKADSDKISLELYSENEKAVIKVFNQDSTLNITVHIGVLIVNAPSNLNIRIISEVGHNKIKAFENGGYIKSKAGYVKIDGIRKGDWEIEVDSSPLMMYLDDNLEKLSVKSVNGPLNIDFININSGIYSIFSENAPLYANFKKLCDVSLDVKTKNQNMIYKIDLPKEKDKYIIGKGTAEMFFSTKIGPIRVLKEE